MKNETKGIIELIIASFFFSLFGVFTRLISNNLGVFSQLLFRALMMSILFGVFAWLTKKLNKIKRGDLGFLLLRGMLIVIDFSCFYFAVTNLPLGLTLFLFYASNVITAFILGSFFLKEQMTLVKYVSVVLALFGLFAMYQDSFIGAKTLPSLAIFISGIAFSITTVTSKKLTNKYDSLQVNLIGYLAAFILVVPVLIFSGEVFTFNLPMIIWIELIGFSLVGVGAFYLTLNGFKHLEAQKASIIMLAELIFVMLIGFFLYSEIPTTNTVIGGLLILFALIIPNINR